MTCFNSRSGLTINSLVDRVKDLKYGSICIFDALGLAAIVSYSIDNSIVNGNLTDKEFVDDEGKRISNYYRKSC